MRIFKIFIFLYFAIVTDYGYASFKTETLVVGEQAINVTHWYKNQSTAIFDNHSQSTIILLSGPTDNWNSDSAWFARIAPKLAKKYRVISIDRSSQILANQNPRVGYAQLGSMLDQILRQLKVDRIKIISFASANLALNQYLYYKPGQTVESILMIDPDVLLPYSIERYKKDSQPFKDNLAKYMVYIESGKYDKRALQKNTSEKTHLKKLAADDPETDWQYVDKIFASRLNKLNLINLFKEIAIYDKDLETAFKHPIASSFPLIIVDTDFEQSYIDKTEDPALKGGLLKWKFEAKKYYRQLVDNSIKGQYIELTTQEHLLPFSQPDLLLELIEP